MTDATEQNQPVYSIEKIYVKDLSLEIPNAPQIFLEREAPNVDVQLHHTSIKVDEGVFQTELTLTVTAKVGEKTMFLGADKVDKEKVPVWRRIYTVDSTANRYRMSDGLLDPLGVCDVNRGNQVGIGDGLVSIRYRWDLCAAGELVGVARP